MPCEQVHTLRLGYAKVLGAGGAVSHLIPASSCCVGTLLPVPASQGAVQVRMTLGEGPYHYPLPALTSRPVDEARLPHTAFLLLPALPTPCHWTCLLRQLPLDSRLTINWCLATAFCFSLPPSALRSPQLHTHSPCGFVEMSWTGCPKHLAQQ